MNEKKNIFHSLRWRFVTCGLCLWKNKYVNIINVCIHNDVLRKSFWIKYKHTGFVHLWRHRRENKLQIFIVFFCQEWIHSFCLCWDYLRLPPMEPTSLFCMNTIPKKLNVKISSQINSFVSPSTIVGQKFFKRNVKKNSFDVFSGLRLPRLIQTCHEPSSTP